MASVELFGQVLSCTSFEDLDTCLLQPVATTLKANSSVSLQFFDLPANGHLVGRRSYVGHHPRSVEVYVEGVYNLDPVLKPSLQWLHSGAADQGAYVSLLSQIPGWHDQAYYREFLFEFNIRHVLGVVIPVRSALGAEMFCLGFHRAHEALYGRGVAATVCYLANERPGVLRGLSCALPHVAANDAALERAMTALAARCGLGPLRNAELGPLAAA